uniref:FAM113A n=1 Tax=Caligus clemensi TaxID=344056 RepID=C1C1V7_CALCM|nr:FAM113A [Caligus clemensi]
MADIFVQKDVHTLTRNQSFLFIGDSNMRAIYKDLIWLSQSTNDSSLIPSSHLRKKLEKSFVGDAPIDSSSRTAGRDYRELRDYYSSENGSQITFYFTTRCFSSQLEERLMAWKDDFGSYPDVVVMNGALWDLSRWGATSVSSYKENIVKLFELMKKILPIYTQLIWVTTSPISSNVKGALILPKLSSIGESLRFTIVEANRYSSYVAQRFSYDVLDLHRVFITQMQRQCPDGIHWYPDSVRMMVNMLLTHFCLSRKRKLPGRISPSKSIHLRQMITAASEADKASKVEAEEHKKEESPGRRKLLKARRRIIP